MVGGRTQGAPYFIDEGQLPPQNSPSHLYLAPDMLGAKVNELLCLLWQSSATAHAHQGLWAPSRIIPPSSGIWALWVALQLRLSFNSIFGPCSASSAEMTLKEVKSRLALLIPSAETGAQPVWHRLLNSCCTWVYKTESHLICPSIQFHKFPIQMKNALLMARKASCWITKIRVSTNESN